MLKNDTYYWWETVSLRRNVKKMSWNGFVVVFNTKIFNMRTINTQHKDFNNLKKGNTAVTLAITKFYELARLYPYLVQTIMEIFKMELAMTDDSRNQPPITVADCV